MLAGIGAEVYVEARKYQDIAWIKTYGYKPVYISELRNYIAAMDIIFNTIPCRILDYEMLQMVGKDCLIIDLASKPGGVDFERAKMLGWCAGCRTRQGSSGNSGHSYETDDL